MSKRLIAIKRVTNDMKELNKCPLEGIGVAQIDNDPLKFVVNIELMSGPYIGYKVQLLMTMSENYPINPPKLLIYPNQMIGEHYHHHIFRTYHEKENYYEFCINLLENVFNMDTNEEHTGWNPAYTISSILLQVQNFISDPDMHNMPSQHEIDLLMKSMDNYQRPFFDGEKQVIHTWKNPFPKMHYSNDNDKNKMDKMKVIMIDRKKEMIVENLTCYFFRENFIDNSTHI